MTRFYIENAEEFDRACRLLDTRFDAKGKKVLDDAE